MRVKVHKLRGMQPETAEKLTAHGIQHSEHLLEAAGHPKARAELAGKLGVEASHLLKLTNHADLARIKGVGTVYADLLEYAGVDSVIELRNRKPENLHTKLAAIAKEHGVKRVPRLDEVQSWVEQAAGLERKVQH